MATEISKMPPSASAQVPQEEEHDDRPFYFCAYCNDERGYDHMEQMCADCFWEYDSLLKRPGRIRWSMWGEEEKTEEQLTEMKSWIKEAKQTLAAFEEKLEKGQDRIHRELEIYEVYGLGGFGAAAEEQEAGPTDSEEMTVKELEEKLIELDEVRKEMRRAARGREFTPEEKTEYDHLDAVAQATVDELTRRNL